MVSIILNLPSTLVSLVRISTTRNERSGYYWITDGPSKVYCGMIYTGSSCEDFYYNNPETGDKLGYYCIDDTQWIYCNMIACASAAVFIPTCAGVGG